MAKTVKELLARAEELRKRASEAEDAAVRVALESCGWFVAPAARALGWYENTLVRLLSSDGRLANLGREAARCRKAAGYKRGNPAMFGLSTGKDVS